MTSDSERQPPLTIFIAVGEESGDQLGAGLMRGLRNHLGGAVRFCGIGGTAMQAEGLTSLFPLSDITFFGLTAVAKGLPRVLARLREASAAALRIRPDVLVIVDSPEFTHRLARRVRRAAPSIPIVDYVSPSVWAWRPGRARAMRSYVDHVLALLPFEPEVHARLGGPPCTYVGHQLVEQVPQLRPNAEEAARRASEPPRLLLLPGSRRGEVGRLLAPFAAAIERVRARRGPLDVVLPTVPHLAQDLERLVGAWPVRPKILVAPDEKRAAFRSARAALAASGTVTLELALAGVPTVAAYRVAAIEAAVARRLIRVPSVILANLVLGENVIPELLQGDCTPERLADALAPLLDDTPERRRQLEAFACLDDIMQIGARPNEVAAEIVVAYARRGRPGASR